MNMPPVPTLRAAHLSPYLDFCYDRNLSVDRLLSKFRLPTMQDFQAEARLPALPTLKFLAHIEQTAGVRDIGVLASKHVSPGLLHPVNQQAVLAAPTLGEALTAFITGAKLESSGLIAWVIEEQGRVRLCTTHNVGAANEETRPLQVHFNLLVLSIIRGFAGQGWVPEMMGFSSSVPLSPVVGHLFPKTQFLFRQDCAWIGLPTEMLGMKSKRYYSPFVAAQDDDVFAIFKLGDYVTALKGMLTSYLPDGYPSIELAAEISGTSVRTLQRTLAQCNTTYSKVVEQARVDAASMLLERSKTKIIDVAYAVGYEDPSHFSRAFRRLKGRSPRAFRVAGAV